MDWYMEKKEDAKKGEEKDSKQKSSRISDDHKPEVVKDSEFIDCDNDNDNSSTTGCYENKSKESKLLSSTNKPGRFGSRRNSRGKGGRLVNSLDLLSGDINVDDSQDSNKLTSCSNANTKNNDDVGMDFASKKPPPVQAETSMTNSNNTDNDMAKRQRLKGPQIETNNSTKHELEEDAKKPSVEKKLEAKSITSNIKWGVSSSMVSFKSKQAEDASSGGKRKRSEDQLVPFQSVGEGKIVEMNMKYYTDDDEDDTSSLDSEQSSRRMQEVKKVTKSFEVGGCAWEEVGPTASVNALRIAIGRKVVKTNCKFSAHLGKAKNPYIKFSFDDTSVEEGSDDLNLSELHASGKREHIVYLNQLTEVKYHHAAEKTEDNTLPWSSTSVIAFRIIPTEQNGLDTFTAEFYDKEDSDESNEKGGRYVLVEVRDTDEFQTMLEKTRQYPVLAAWLGEESKIQHSNLNTYTKVLVEHTVAEEARAKAEKERKAVLDELKFKYEIPNHLAKLASFKSKCVLECLDWVCNNHGNELVYRNPVLPISNCPHAGNQLDLNVSDEKFMKAVSEGGLHIQCQENDDKILCLSNQMYSCLQCQACTEGACTHRNREEHCLAVSLFDLTIWCSECKAHFKDSSLEALVAKYKHFHGWVRGFEVEYEKGVDTQGIVSWQVVSIRKPDSNVVDDFGRWHFDRMGHAMSRSNLLCTIDLSNCLLSKEDLSMIFKKDAPTSPLLEHLDLSGVMLEEEGMGVLEPFLSSRTSLATLNLDRNSLGLEGIKLLARALNHIRVEDLYLDDCDICSKGVKSLLLSTNAQYLKDLRLSSNRIGSLGYKDIAQFLLKDESSIKTLFLSNNKKMTGPDAQYLANSIQKSCIEYICIGKGSSVNEGVTQAVGPFENVVCNLDDFQSLLQCNHQIRSFGDRADAYFSRNSNVIPDALDINSRYNQSVGTRIRSKLRRFYFVGEFDMSPFAELDANLMPSLLELVTMSDESCESGRLEAGTVVLAQNGCLRGIYRLVRNYWNLQELFSYTSPEAKIKQLEEEKQLAFEENARLKEEVEQLKMANEKAGKSTWRKLFRW